MYQRILLPTDGSEASLHAIRAGAEFARTMGAEVVVMTATPEFSAFTATNEAIEQSRQEYEAAARARAQRLLDDGAAVVRDAGVTCHAVQAMADNPYEAIIATAREQKCDLIVMASHGRKGIAGLLLGSETQKVLARSTIPVMVHRALSRQEPGAPIGYKRILVPTDGSAISAQVLPAAIEFARACQAEIVALAVAVPEPILPSIEGAMVVDPGRQFEALQEEARTLAAAVAEKAVAAGVRCTPLVRLAQYPAETIVDTAREQACDLIFMGSHGRRGIGLLLAGSVTQAVLAAAPVPVMVLRPRAAAA